MDNLGDSQCVRLKTLKKGTACLYRVQSKCGVPNLKLNDTSSNIFSASIMLSNTTITPAVSAAGPSCVDVRNQQCICKVGANSTNLTCDCQTVYNTTFDNSMCTSCKTLTDSAGNVLRNCTCGVPVPIQSKIDQQCKCQRVTDPVTKNTSLSCTNCGIANTPAKTITLNETQCKCINAYDTTTNKTYLSCICTGVKQCVSPSSRAQSPPAKQGPPPCSSSYPCSCAQVNGSLTCNCTNPQSQLTAPIFNDASQCQCALVFYSNGTYTQNCNCCLKDEFVRSNLLQPVECQGPNSLKEQCSCTNSTLSNTTNATKLTCNCIHPVSNVLASNLVFQSIGQCDCANIDSGVKACNCCVPYDTQVQQMTPICAAASNLESCMCSAQSGNSTKQTCSCSSQRSNLGNLTFSNIVNNNSACYCNPNQ